MRVVFVERERERERQRDRERQTGYFWPKPDGCWCAGKGGKVKTSFHWLYEWQSFMVCIIIFNSLSPFPPSFINFVTFFPIFLLPYLPVVGLKTLLSKIVCFPAFQNPLIKLPLTYLQFLYETILHGVEELVQV